MSLPITDLRHRRTGRLRTLVASLSIFVVALMLSACGVNDIPTKDEAAVAAWAQVLNQYKRRADLIPNLVETVKGYAKHERETLEAVVEARNKATQTQLPSDILTNPDAFRAFQESQNQLTSALSRLLVVVERYPDLKASQNYLALQSQLEGTENRIAVARRDFINAVRDYNTELRTFPGRLWAQFLYADAVPKETFTVAEEGLSDPPKIQF